MRKIVTRSRIHPGAGGSKTLRSRSRLIYTQLVRNQRFQGPKGSNSYILLLKEKVRKLKRESRSRILNLGQTGSALLNLPDRFRSNQLSKLQQLSPQHLSRKMSKEVYLRRRHTLRRNIRMFLASANPPLPHIINRSYHQGNGASERIKETLSCMQTQKPTDSLMAAVIGREAHHLNFKSMGLLTRPPKITCLQSKLRIMNKNSKGDPRNYLLPQQDQPGSKRMKRTFKLTE